MTSGQAISPNLCIVTFGPVNNFVYHSTVLTSYFAVSEKKILSPKYIVLFVAAILAGTVSAIYYFHNRQQNSTSEEQHEQTREAISDAPVAAVTHCGSSPPNPSVVNVDQSNENMNETRFEEPAPALGTDNLPPPQYEYQGLPLKDDEIPSYEEVMANDHIYQKPV